MLDNNVSLQRIMLVFAMQVQNWNVSMECVLTLVVHFAPDLEQNAGMAPTHSMRPVLLAAIR